MEQDIDIKTNAFPVCGEKEYNCTNLEYKRLSGTEWNTWKVKVLVA